MFHFDACKQKKIFVLEISLNFEDFCFGDKNEALACLLDIAEASLSPAHFGSITEENN